MSEPDAPVESLRTILASDKSSREAAAKQAAILQRESERRQSAYREFTATFDAVYEFGIELVNRPKREVVIETTRTDWLSWVKLWRRAAEHLTDKMKGALRDFQSAKLPSLFGIAVHVLLSQSTVSDEELADLLRVLIEDPGTRDFVEWLPWLRDELHPPIMSFSERHQCHRVPEHAGMPFWLSPDEYVNPEYAAFFGHCGTANNDNASMPAKSDIVKSQLAGQTEEKPVDDDTAGTPLLPSPVEFQRFREFAHGLSGDEAKVVELLLARLDDAAKSDGLPLKASEADVTPLIHLQGEWKFNTSGQWKGLQTRLTNKLKLVPLNWRVSSKGGAHLCRVETSAEQEQPPAKNALKKRARTPR